MPKLDMPLLLTPAFKEKPWGRRDLAPLFDPEDELKAGRPRSAKASKSGTGRPKRKHPIGEIWLTGDSARFRNGPVAGQTLAEVSTRYGPELHGPGWNHQRFPVLAKFLYTQDWLSVQVHPDDPYARRCEPASLGKCEMWYIVDAAPDAACLLGMRPAATKEALRKAAVLGGSRELLREFHPHAEEAVFVPPGTVHALGPGLILFEVEQNSDVTFRIDDFGRKGLDGKPRELHLKQGLEVARPDLPTHRNLPHLEFSESYGSRRWVLACPSFAMEELRVTKMAAFCGSPIRVEGLVVALGEGRVETYAGWLGYHTGETWLIPPAVQDYRIVPLEPTRLFKFYVPDLEQDFRRPLRARGVKPAEIARLVFESS